jgi:SpoIIAA-like
MPERGISVIKELSDLPPGVIGFEVADTLKAEDYRDVILPALERAAASGEVRFVVVIPEFHGMSGGALWQDLKVVYLDELIVPGVHTRPTSR